MSVAIGIALAGVAAGGLVQSATGFGFALIAAPVATAALGPALGVPTVVVASLVVNTLTLAGERRRPAVIGRDALVLTLASLPGMAVGAAILANASADVLRVIVALVVAGSVVAVVRGARPRQGERPSGAGAGLVSGALATTSGINGPPLLLHLRRVGADPVQARDTLAIVFVGSGVLTLVSLALAGALRLPAAAFVVVAGAVAGQVAGRWAFAALEGRREAATRCVLALSVAVAAVPALQALA